MRRADLEELWSRAEPLPADALPGWLGKQDAWWYRRLPVGTVGAEVQQRLEERGAVCEPTWIYLPDPTEAIFSIGICRGPAPLELDPADARPVLTRDDVTDVSASYVADPFLARSSNGWHMLFEVWNWEANKGEIGLASSADGDNWSYDGIVLAEQFHLSYPHVFCWEEDWYLVPESSQANEVRLYRAADFPRRWTQAGTLLEGEYVDPSLFRFEERWWLFAGRGHDELRLFGADSLSGPWVEHPESPVVAGDLSRARPAGRVLVEKARLVRFGQDCSPVYGSAVHAFEIVELTPERYRERPLSQRPLMTGSGRGWNAGGMHHVDLQNDPRGGWIAAVDGWDLRPGGATMVAPAPP